MPPGAPAASGEQPRRVPIHATHQPPPDAPPAYTEVVDKVRLGRALGYGTRHMAKTVAAVAEAATAPQPISPPATPVARPPPAASQPASGPGAEGRPTPLRPRRPRRVEPRSSPASRRPRKVFETLSLAAAGGLLRRLVATGDRRLLRTFGQHNGCRGLAPALRSPHRGRICWRPPFLAIRVLHRPVRLLCGEQLPSGEFEGTPRIVSAVTFSRICRVPPDSPATERTRAPRWPAQI